MSLLNLRYRMLLSVQKKSLLPSEYQRVEYIESVENSNQTKQPIIDSKIIPTINIGINIVYSSTVAKTQSQFVIGARNKSGGTIFYGLNGSSSPTNGKYLFDVFLNGAKTFNTMERVDGAKMQSSLTPMGEGTFDWDLTNLDTGEHTLTIANGSNISTTETIRIFGFSTSHTLDRMKLYECQIYDSGILVRNFIPCYRKSDNVIGLFDTVYGEFYTSTQGEFTKGADV
jgi:hypothetical protein